MENNLLLLAYNMVHNYNTVHTTPNSPTTTWFIRHGSGRLVTVGPTPRWDSSQAYILHREVLIFFVRRFSKKV
ncbi:hypothetical protein LINPERPRIM_LOCUS12690 [Linum perenne]